MQHLGHAALTIDALNSGYNSSVSGFGSQPRTVASSEHSSYQLLNGAVVYNFGPA
jgi:hypothetical protein